MWNKIVTAAWDWVSWAEKNLLDKTGPEKKELVIAQLIKAIDWPYVPDFVETPIERIVYGYLIDRACAWANKLTNGNFADLELSVSQVEQVTELMSTDPATLPEVPEATGVDEKLNALYAKYTEKK